MDNSHEEKVEKKSNKIIIVSAISIVLIAIVIAVLLLTGTLKFGDKKGNEKKSTGEVTQEEITKNYKYKLNVYKQSNGYGSGDLILCVDSDECTDLAFTIPTEAENAKVITTSYIDNNRKFILYEDNGLKIYNYKANKIKKILLKNEYDEYVFILNKTDTDVLGIVYYTIEDDEDTMINTKAGFYNISTKKMMYEKDNYSSIRSLDDDHVQANKLIDDKEELYKYYVLNINDEKKVFETASIYADFSGLYAHDTKEGKIYNFYTSSELTDDYLYTSNFQLIKNSENKYNLSDEGVYVLDKNNVNLYNAKGEKIKSYSVSGDVKQVFDKYYVTVDNGALYIKSYDNTLNKKLINWESKYKYDNIYSGQYEANELSEEVKNSGYYFIIGIDGEEGGIEVHFNPDTNEVKKWDLEVIGGYAKPVLYLYPTEKTNVEINFQNEKALTVTYPKFKDKWSVIAYPNGDLYDKDGKYYYGLYWEEDKNHEVSFDEGFYVTKDNAIEFLEEKLEYIGLNNKEKNEFIMYWLPILEKNGKNLVYFELTDEREAYNKIEISPKPDSLLRIAIHVKKVDSYTKIKEQKLVKFERKGFTAVEWGGVSH